MRGYRRLRIKKSRLKRDRAWLRIYSRNCSSSWDASHRPVIESLKVLVLLVLVVSRRREERKRRANVEMISVLRIAMTNCIRTSSDSERIDGTVLSLCLTDTIVRTFSDKNGRFRVISGQLTDFVEVIPDTYR